MEELDFRYSQIQDSFSLSKWLEDEENAKWFPFSNVGEKGIFMRNWIYFFQRRASLTVILDGKICGIGTLFLLPYKKVAHHSTFYLIVVEKKNKEEIEKSLIKNIIHLARNYFQLEILYAEVFEGYPLIPALKEFGFQQSVIQKDYVREEDGSFKARIIFEREMR